MEAGVHRIIDCIYKLGYCEITPPHPAPFFLPQISYWPNEKYYYIRVFSNLGKTNKKKSLAFILKV